MLCDKYKKELIEATGSGAALPKQRREHVDVCVRCHGIVAAQQILFAAIDMGLHTTANAEVPSSFLPDLRAKLVVETAPARARIYSWASACAAATLVLVVTLVSLPRHYEKQAGEESLGKANTTPAVANAIRLDPIQARKTPPRVEVRTEQNLLLANRDPEVLVPKGEERFLEQYYASLRKSDKNVVLAAEHELEPQPLKIEQIEVKELKIESLEEETGVQQTHSK
jgi:hypothetical protein